MIHVTEFAFTGYPVTDMPRARAFYEGVLQLEPSACFEHEGRHWVEYELGTGTLAITNLSPNWKPSTSGPAVALEVADFDHAINELRNNQVTFLIEPSETAGCRLAVITDPDGNSLAVHKRKAR